MQVWLVCRRGRHCPAAQLLLPCCARLRCGRCLMQPTRFTPPHTAGTCCYGHSHAVKVKGVTGEGGRSLSVMSATAVTSVKHGAAAHVFSTARLPATPRFPLWRSQLLTGAGPPADACPSLCAPSAPPPPPLPLPQPARAAACTTRLCVTRRAPSRSIAWTSSTRTAGAAAAWRVRGVARWLAGWLASWPAGWPGCRARRSRPRRSPPTPATSHRLPTCPAPPTHPPPASSAAGCPAYTVVMPTGDPLVPQWCVTYKEGKSKARHGCYGRLGLAEIVATVGGRPVHAKPVSFGIFVKASQKRVDAEVLNCLVACL